MQITDIKNIPLKKLILVTGAPGAGKSTLSQQIALDNIASGRRVIFVITEATSEGLIQVLMDKGLGLSIPDSLSIVDAYTQTIGLVCSPQINTICANCADLNSISMAITKIQSRFKGDDNLLVFDSLTSPYIFNGPKVIKFIYQFLIKFAQDGNRVLVNIDEGCGKEEDLGAMMSVAEGIIRLSLGTEKQMIQVIKHPKIAPGVFDHPIPGKFKIPETLDEIMESEFISRYMDSLFRGKTCFRPILGDYVNAFWPKLAYWSGILWDPQGFPITIYEHNREDQSGMGSDLFISIIPQPYKTMFRMIKLFQRIGIFPSVFNRLEDIQKLWRRGLPYSGAAEMERYGKIEFLPDISHNGEYHYRIYQNSDCWDLEGMGTTIASYLPPAMAGNLMGLETRERNWNAVETKCIGLGDPYCEVKIFPGESDEIEELLIKDADTVSRIHARLIDLFTAHILEDKKLTNRSQFDPCIHLQIPFHNFGFAHIAGDHSRMAIRMGGAVSGKKLAERLLDSGLLPDEVIDQVFDSLKTLKAGIVTKTGNRIIISENIEPLRTKHMTRLNELSCHFTTGFLNGLYRATYNLQVQEIKCLAAGDEVCEWEII